MQIRPFVLNAIALISLIGVTSVGRADDKKDIKAVYARVVKAIMAKDVKALMATGTEDFSYTENGQTMSGDQVATTMQQQFQAVTGPEKVKMTVASCNVTGNTAEVIATESSVMQVKGSDGKPHKITSNGKSKDTLVKTEKGWLMKSVTILSSVMTMDGKPYDPGKAMPESK